MILYTIGYRGATRARLIEVLQGAGVVLVIDCRESASGVVEFRKDELLYALRGAGISYRHHPEYGNPFRPPRYTGPDALVRYETRARQRQLGGRVWEWACSACLLCACSDPNQCHRGVLARLAVEASRGALEVRHLSTARPREVQGGLFGDDVAPIEAPGEEH